MTGGDDQALGLTLLQLDVQPPLAGSMGSRSGGGISSNEGRDGSSSATGIACRELLRLTIPSAHSSALRSVWVSSLLPVPSGGIDAAAQPAAAAATGTQAGDAAGGAALQATAFTLGLDQQLRRWRLHLQPCQLAAAVGGDSGPGSSGCPNSSGPSSSWADPPADPPVEDGFLGLAAAAPAAEPWLETACYSASTVPIRSSSSPSGSGGGGTGWSITAEEAGCRFTQVAEPAALDVLPSGGDHTVALPGPTGSFVIAVAGRGTELLTWQG